MAPSSSSLASSSPKKTQEAFADACRGFVQELDAWTSEIEWAFIHGVRPDIPTPSTPMSLIKHLDDKFGRRLDNISSLIPISDDPPVLLNSIHAMLLAAPPGNIQKQTLDLFVKTASPVWAMLGRWLVNGMPLPTSLTSGDDYILQLDDDEKPIDTEFFIKRDRDVSWTDEDFWDAGHIVNPESGWPEWMGETKDLVMEAGKAKGLLKGLVGDNGDSEVVEDWKGLHHLAHDQVLDLRREIELHLAPMCQIAIFRLRRVLEEECGLEQHLEAIEGIMYMKAHDTMDTYLGWLYDQVRSFAIWLEGSANGRSGAGRDGTTCNLLRLVCGMQ